MRQFQSRRGLDVTGQCDSSTWAALVEAGFRLGDRMLYLHAPMIRGDDVHDVQLDLSALGFHHGRVDGIFGPATRDAVAEFQRNVGLTPDGVVGPDTISALRRLRRRPGTSTPVASVRERHEHAPGPRGLAGLRLVLGDSGSAATVLGAVTRGVRGQGAVVLSMSHPDGSVLAATANRFRAEVFIGIELSVEAEMTAKYFRTDGFESRSGRDLARDLADTLARTVGAHSPSIQGMRLAVLRETRMPAVVLRLGPSSAIVPRAALVSEAVVEGLIGWLSRDPDRQL